MRGFCTCLGVERTVADLEVRPAYTGLDGSRECAARGRRRKEAPSSASSSAIHPAYAQDHAPGSDACLTVPLSALYFGGEGDFRAWPFMSLMVRRSRCERESSFCSSLVASSSCRRAQRHRVWCFHTAPVEERRAPDSACPVLRPAGADLTSTLFRQILRRIEPLGWHPT